jgi:uncharacterized membrane protein YozB (DUF420 family)
MVLEILKKTFVSLPGGPPGWAIVGVSLLLIAIVVVLLAAPAEALFRRGFFAGANADWLPHLNAGLNGASLLLLSVGYAFIRQRRVRQHRLSMLSALFLSALFLTSYLIYHSAAGSTAFSGPRWVVPIYYAVLISHIVLAMVVVPLVLATLYWAWRGTFGQHRRLARWSLPVWIYVSASGVAVYLLLYGLN